MPRLPRKISRSGMYHVMFRGANRQEVFHDDQDFNKLLCIVEKYRIESSMSIYAWCFMNNHVHLLLKEGNESLSNTMKRIGVSYVSYYNLKYHTNGHLFQDRFKSENVETYQYARTVTRYIHQNPVKAGMVGHVCEWRWSSCHEYYGRYYPHRLVDTDFILGMFSTEKKDATNRFIEFNEMHNYDVCLDEGVDKRKLTDDEARPEIKRVLDGIEIVEVKSLPKAKRSEVLHSIKSIKGVSQRQAARILGISPNLIFRA